jgi:hypothetical protein
MRCYGIFFLLLLRSGDTCMSDVGSVRSCALEGTLIAIYESRDHIFPSSTYINSSYTHPIN